MHLRDNYYKIRKERNSDIPQITNIHNRAFNNPVEGKIVGNLRKNRKLAISLVCEIGDRIVGHIAYSPVYVENRIIGLGLAPVAVLPGFQKKGIGSALIRAGNEIAVSEGFFKIFVIGEPGFYSKFGFEQAKRYNYFSKFDPEGNYFMILKNKIKKKLKKTDVEYCEEFND